MHSFQTIVPRISKVRIGILHDRISIITCRVAPLVSRRHDPLQHDVAVCDDRTDVFDISVCLFSDRNNVKCEARGVTNGQWPGVCGLPKWLQHGYSRHAVRKSMLQPQLLRVL